MEGEPSEGGEGGAEGVTGANTPVSAAGPGPVGTPA